MLGSPGRLEGNSIVHSSLHFIDTLPEGELLRRQQSANRALLNMRITFSVYGDSAGTERIFPFDLVPRIVAASEWHGIERGLKQRRGQPMAAMAEHLPRVRGARGGW